MDFSTYQDTLLPDLTSQLAVVAAVTWAAAFWAWLAGRALGMERRNYLGLTGATAALIAAGVFIFVAVLPWFPRPIDWLGTEIQKTYGVEVPRNVLETMSMLVSTSTEKGTGALGVGAVEVLREGPAAPPIQSTTLTDLLDPEEMPAGTTLFGPFDGDAVGYSFLALQYDDGGWRLMNVVTEDADGQELADGAVLEELPRVSPSDK